MSVIYIQLAVSCVPHGWLYEMEGEIDSSYEWVTHCKLLTKNVIMLSCKIRHAHIYILPHALVYLVFSSTGRRPGKLMSWHVVRPLANNCDRSRSFNFDWILIKLGM
jgi:hypothetical protein